MKKFKVILLGDAGVGKSAIRTKFGEDADKTDKTSKVLFFIIFKHSHTSHISSTNSPLILQIYMHYSSISTHSLTKSFTPHTPSTNSPLILHTYMYQTSISTHSLTKTIHTSHLFNKLTAHTAHICISSLSPLTLPHSHAHTNTIVGFVQSGEERCES